MAPSTKAITAGLRKAVEKVFKEDRLNLTVNNVRKTASESLGLEQDFFKSETWKEKSKNIISEYSVCLQSLSIYDRILISHPRAN